MDDRSTRVPRLDIVIPGHPEKQLSPNAAKTGSMGQIIGRRRAIKGARDAGWLAARDVFVTAPLLYTLGLTVEHEDLVIETAVTVLPGDSLHVAQGVEIIPALAWLVGPITIDATVWWGHGRARHDDDGCMGSLKNYRDGIADWLGTSDRQWAYAGPPVQRFDRKRYPFGRVLFTLTPRE